MARNLNRRKFFGNSLAFSAGMAAGLSLEEKTLLAQQAAGSDSTAPEERITGLPKGKIGKLEISRLICGGNLFSGFAHSRDLTYASALMLHYFTDEKIMDTLQVCEENGINTAILRCDAHIVRALDKYRKERRGKIQWVAQTYPDENNLTENIQLAIDNGAVGAYMQGGIGDRFVANGRLDLVDKIISFVKGNGLIAGIGSHLLAVPVACEQQGLNPDFYFKTFNNDVYYSAGPQQVVDFFKKVQKPWIAFKVLGAGVVAPGEGFRYSFSMGADFINVGMFDWQVKEDIKLVKEILAGDLKRERPWRA